jgi:predicted membrane protein
MKGQFKVVFGIILIAIGVLGVLTNMDIIDFDVWSLWAYIYFGIGVLFEVAYFTSGRKSGGLLIVAGIFLVIGAIFILCTLFSWGLMVDLWPLFIVAPGFGFIQTYFIHKRRTGYLIPGAILLFIGAIFMNYMVFGWNQNIVFSVAIVLIGLAILVKPSKTKRKVSSEMENEAVYNQNQVNEETYEGTDNSADIRETNVEESKTENQKSDDELNNPSGEYVGD